MIKAVAFICSLLVATGGWLIMSEVSKGNLDVKVAKKINRILIGILFIVGLFNVFVALFLA